MYTFCAYRGGTDKTDRHEARRIVPTFLRIAINIACFRATFFSSLYFHTFLREMRITLFARSQRDGSTHLTAMIVRKEENITRSRVRGKIIGRDHPDETGQRGETFPEPSNAVRINFERNPLSIRFPHYFFFSLQIPPHAYKSDVYETRERTGSNESVSRLSRARATFLIEGHQETMLYAKPPYRSITVIRRRRRRRRGRRRRRRRSDRRYLYISSRFDQIRGELFPSYR